MWTSNNHQNWIRDYKKAIKVNSNTEHTADNEDVIEACHPLSEQDGVGSSIEYRDEIADGRMAKYAYACSCERKDGRLAYRFFKRAFDIVFSAVIILLLLVPSLLLCIAIRIESPGCPIYVQNRVGRIGKHGELYTFPMLKFRSMYKDADKRLKEIKHLNEADGPLFKMKDDPRVTRIGKFIRKHSLDELPQFINCFLGQLSTVGPRPPLPNEVLEYDEKAMQRLSVKPGLTGYWQVRGRSDLTFDEMVDLDLLYIKERSFKTDIWLIAKTISVVLTGGGAY